MGMGNIPEIGLWVDDHAIAIDLIFHKGKIGDTYNIGGHNEWKNIDLVNKLCDVMDELLDRKLQDLHRSLITFVKDRPGHDRSVMLLMPPKLKMNLGWEPTS